MADFQSFLSNFFPNFPFRIINHSKEDIPMLFLCSLFIFFTFCVLILSFSLYKRLKKIDLEQNEELIKNPNEIDPVELGHYLTQSDQTHLARSVLFEVLPADSPKWESLFVKEGFDDDDDELDFKGFDSDKELRDCGLEQGKRKKKKGKKKKLNSLKGEEERDEMDFGSCSVQELTLLYPFTSSSSVMQRKIKQQYEELMKCNESKELTLAQVRQFANCLINARSKLQHKADVIHRKFTITKALLYKADRSSFDRLRQQINKLEMEQKRLEEDTFVYNWLQQQLKFSPAYKKLLEIGTCMELLKKSEKSTENTDHKYTDTSFEELLAREKKDSFWQRNGKLRSCSS